jgi:hypothetical protein
MKQLKFSILCEDDAQFFAITSFLSQLAQDKVALDFNQAYYKQFKCSNKSDVVNKLKQASAYIVLPKYELDLLLAGIDYDYKPIEDFEIRLKFLQDKVVDVAKNKTIIFLPVQEIEHWLFFIKHKIDNPTSSKNIINEVEKRESKTTKSLVYKNIVDKEDYIKLLINHCDLEWLSHQSKSFNHFKKSVATFLEKFAKQ